jgi:hypothetical protein
MNKMIGGKHIQHSNKFINELNSINNKTPYTPFRISDEIWLVGKYKGFKLNNIPKSYLQWVLKQFNLNGNAKSIIEEKINQYDNNKKNQNT